MKYGSYFVEICRIVVCSLAVVPAITSELNFSDQNIVLGKKNGPHYQTVLKHNIYIIAFTLCITINNIYNNVQILSDLIYFIHVYFNFVVGVLKACVFG